MRNPFARKSTLSPVIAGLAQASGVMAYVLLTAFLATSGSVLFEPLLGGNPLIGAVGFLGFFCFSVLVCGSMTIGYPAFLCIEKRYARAFAVIGWTIGWMFLYLAVLTLVLATSVPQQAGGY